MIKPQPAHGKARVGCGGRVTYRPTVGFVGTDHFRYTTVNRYGGTAHGTVTLTVTDVAPALAPVHPDTDENTPVSLHALGRASAAKGNTLHLSAVGSPRHDKAVIGRHGKVTYTPDQDYAGRDSFSYTVTDNHGGTATARVTVSVASATTSSDSTQGSPTATDSVLPDTGASISPGTIGTGGLLVALGSLLIGWSRRRPRRA